MLNLFENLKFQNWHSQLSNRIVDLIIEMPLLSNQTFEYILFFARSEKFKLRTILGPEAGARQLAEVSAAKSTWNLDGKNVELN
jgi:hypothetical protein